MTNFVHNRGDMAREMDEIDRKALNAIQEEVPLVPRPFAALGEKIGLSEDEVIQRVGALRGGPHPVIRQISAIFDTKALGYRSTLVAAQVEANRIDEAAQIINHHPGVTHNYRRNHSFNLWYTLAVPPDSRLGLEKTVERLHQESGATSTRMLPTLKLFKIGVRLNLGDDVEVTARSERPRFSEAQRKHAEQFMIGEADKRMIRVLQQDLPVVAEPFAAWAESAGVSVEQLLASVKSYQEQSVMRRFSAVLHHREVGFSANGMGVWVVPEADRERFGQIAAGFDAVSHCYLRPTYPDWPYSIFTMVHAKDEGACRAVLEAIRQAAGVGEYGALFSSVQYKKVRLKYFTPEIEEWERNS